LTLSLPIFEQIASALTIKAICGPLGPDIPVDADEDKLNELFGADANGISDPLNDPCRVIDANGRTIGMVQYGDWYDYDQDRWLDETVDEVMQPNQMILSLRGPRSWMPWNYLPPPRVSVSMSFTLTK
jgi:hypothetical protein